MQEYCKQIVYRVDGYEGCGRVLSIDGTCPNVHVKIEKPAGHRKAGATVS